MGNIPCCTSRAHPEIEVDLSHGDSPFEEQQNASLQLNKTKKAESLEYAMDRVYGGYQTFKYTGLAAGSLVAARLAPIIKEIISTASPTGKAIMSAVGGIASYKGYGCVKKTVELEKDRQINKVRDQYEERKEGDE